MDNREKNTDEEKKKTWWEKVWPGLVTTIIGGIVVFIVTTGKLPDIIDVVKGWIGAETPVVETPVPTPEETATETPGVSETSNTEKPKEQEVISAADTAAQNTAAGKTTDETEKPGYVKVPDVINMTFEEAQEVLNAKGIGASSATYKGEEKDKTQLYVFEQSVAPGELVPEGISIELIKIGAKKGDRVTVPNVVGMEQDEAIVVLRSAGLLFTVSVDEEDLGEEGELYYVKMQDIPESSVVDAGTKVPLKLTVKR